MIIWWVAVAAGLALVVWRGSVYVHLKYRRIEEEDSFTLELWLFDRIRLYRRTVRQAIGVAAGKLLSGRRLEKARQSRGTAKKPDRSGRWRAFGRLLEMCIRDRFPDADESYYTWYENEKISAFILDYCLAQYRKCAASGPLVFRGGEYRFGAALVKKLAEKGFAADASYHFLRPQRRPDNKQFVYENGLLAFPVGILSKQAHPDRVPLNFNFKTLYPTSPDAYDSILGCLLYTSRCV